MSCLRWLVLKHRNKEAALVLSKINNKAEVDQSFVLKDFREMQKTCSKANIAEFFKWKYIRRLVDVNRVFIIVNFDTVFFPFFLRII